MKPVGVILLLLVAAVAAAAPWIAPNPPTRRFPELLYAPPTPIHLFGPSGGAAYIHPWRLVNRLERRFEPDHRRVVPLRWFTSGALVTADPDGGAPLLLLGADGFGRDIFARLVHGARPTLLLAATATVAASLLGALAGAVAGYRRGWVDAVLSRCSEFVLVLPTIYVALALRAVVPLVLPPAAVFALLAAILTLLGWPIVARGVRAIVLVEREREYAVAARALGAGGARLLWRHLLPAARGYIGTQAALLLPAFILAEATLSYVGLGFPDSSPTWGTMLQEAANVALLGDAPWTLAPAAAIFVVVLAANLLVQGRGRAPVQYGR
ncbi:MAG TPA: ABC transporter permease [Vicinamibacterales bacterium]|nr:ABC transporter permease [Vicinamibacterales bacterium]